MDMLLYCSFSFIIGFYFGTLFTDKLQLFLNKNVDRERRDPII